MKIIEAYKKIPFLTKMLVALILGGITGWIVGESIAIIKPVGTFFLNSLKMVAFPLIFVNVIAGVASLDDPRSFGRVGGRIVVYYTLTTVFAIFIGIVVAYVFKPGVGFQFTETYELTVDKAPSLLATLLDLIPSNIFASLANGRFDQVVIFSLFVGLTILFLPDDLKNYLTDGVKGLSTLLSRMMNIVMGFAPFGIFALIATTMGQYGSKLVGAVLKYIGSMYVAILLMVVVYLALVAILAKVSPVRFLKKSMPLIITTISTSSSLVALPVNLKCADSLNVPRKISDFTLPLGMQLNKDGNGIMLSLAVIFAAQAAGITLPLGVLINMMILSLVLTTGGAGIPGAGPVHIAIVVQTFGLPLEVVGIIAGVFALVDMGVTTINCLGDLAGTVIVSRLEDKRLVSSGSTSENS